MNIKNTNTNWMKLVRMFCFIILATGIFVSVNGTSEVNAATVGQTISQPEEGWRRIDDADSRINYLGTGWFKNSFTYYYNGSLSATNTYGDNVSFNFSGTKLRIIGAQGTNGSSSIKITIDDVDKSYYQSASSGQYQSLSYEILNLNNKLHTVKITNLSSDSDYIWIDAIDIDSTGSLVDQNATLVTGITLNKSTDTLNVGATDPLTATITPATATNQSVTWTSSDTSIATVDSVTGKVTGQGVGSATITATTTDGSNLSAPCVVTVTDSSTGTGTGTGSGTNTGTTTGGGTGTGTVSSTDRAMLIITMSTGVIKQYDLSANDVNAFLTWYDAKSKGTAQSYYVMPNATNIAPYLSKKDYIPYDKIDDFQVDEYKSN